MTYPDVPLGYLVEVAPGADTSTDPDTWPWTDATNDLVANIPIKHKRGNDDEQGDTSSESSLTFRNPDRRWTTDNPLSDMWPGWNVDCPIRCSLSLDGSSTWHELFTQFAAEITDTWGGTGGKLPRTAVQAAGVFRRLGQGDTARSAMYRTMAGTALGDFVPVAYYSLEDGEDASRFASATPGVDPLELNGWTLAVDDSLPGSLPLPSFDGEAYASGPLPAYTDTGQWVAQIAVKAAPLAALPVSIYSVEMATRGKIAVGIDADLEIAVIAWFNNIDDLTPTGSVTSGAFPGQLADQWVSVVVMSTQVGGGSPDTATVKIIDINGATIWQTTTNTSVGLHGQATRVNISGAATSTGQPGTYGHFGIWVDPAFTLGTDDLSNLRAMGGWNGEMAHDRIARLLRELRIASDITATTSTPMGPQKPGRALDLILEASDADHGILDDSRGRVSYRALREMYGQTAALVIDAAEYELGFPLRSVTDDQQLVNTSTVTRRDGSSATVDRSNGAAPRRQDEELNLFDDTQPAHHASFYVSLGQVRGKRVPQITVNFRAAPQLAAAFLALRLGDRVQIVNAPQELAHTGTLDLIWVGWTTATVRRKVLTATANCAPYAPYAIGAYGSTTGTTTSKYGPKNSALNADITSSATSVVVASGGDKWATTASHAALFPAGGGGGIGVEIGGLTYLCTAITGTGAPTYTLTLVRLADDKAHSAGDLVKVVPLPKYGL